MSTAKRFLLATSALLLCIVPAAGQAQEQGNALGLGQTASTPEFHLKSKMIVTGAQTPHTHNLTLFSKGLVYDFQHGPNPKAAPTEIVIFNSRTKQIVLLDLARQVKLEMHDLNLLKLLDGVRREAEKDRRTRFLVHDQYQEEVDATNRSVALTSDNIRYAFEGIAPEDPRIMPLYFEFLDVFTRLQASDPQKIPPFPRIRLNQAIRRVGWVPTTVEIQVSKNELFAVPFSARTEHSLGNSLSETHRKQIREAKEKWVRFKSVTLAEYRGFRPTPKLQKIFRSANAEDGNVKQR